MHGATIKKNLLSPHNSIVSALAVLGNVKSWLYIKLAARRPEETNNVLKRTKLPTASHLYEALLQSIKFTKTCTTIANGRKRANLWHIGR
jgi:hypothetical protein